MTEFETMPYPEYTSKGDTVINLPMAGAPEVRGVYWQLGEVFKRVLTRCVNDSSYKKAHVTTEYDDNNVMIKVTSISANCDNISDSESRDSCYLDRGIYEGNVTFCERISDKDVGYACKAVLADEPRLCESIESDYNRDSCFAALAGQKKDIDLCGKITEKQFMLECKRALSKME